MSRIFLAINDSHFFNGLKFCNKHGINLEIETFAKPYILDERLEEYLNKYREGLEGFDGMVSMHGPFYDLYPGSIDKKIRATCKTRFLEFIDVAEKLNVKTVIFHFNYIPFIRTKEFRKRWTGYAVEFWSDFANELKNTDITVAMENLWEPDPELMVTVLESINSEKLKICFDTGHSHLFSELSLEKWVDGLGDYLFYMHVHNNFGYWDEHLPLQTGDLDYHKFFTFLKSKSNPYISMEFEGTEAEFEQSLQIISEFFN